MQLNIQGRLQGAYDIQYVQFLNKNILITIYEFT